MAVSSNAPRAAIVTTLRNAGAVLDSFVAYHRAIGFERLYLFFDDPNDPDLPRAGAMPGVTAIAHDEALRSAWRDLPQFSEHQDHIDTEVMSRQVLNALLCMQRGREEGFDWLLSIDSDELFLNTSGDLRQHFEALNQAGVDTVVYANWEAIPETDDVTDFFREVELFKLAVNMRPANFETARPAIQARFPQITPYYHFYDNGKSAVRLGAEGMAPDGVHRFKPKARPRKMVRSKRQFILHYACCGFQHFWSKYQTLGQFEDLWWGRGDIAKAIGTLHLESRDIVATGDRQAALKFYRERIAIVDPTKARALIEAGFATRIETPKKILGEIAETTTSA